MPSPVEWFTNRVEIPFTKNGLPQLVSLAGIVPADTTSVVIQMIHEGLLVTKNVSAYGFGCGVTMTSLLLPQDDIFTVCECNDALHQVVLSGTDSDIHAYVLAAFYGPGTHSHATALKRTANDIGELSTWITRSVFPSSYDPEDIEAVLLVFWQTDATLDTTFGARNYGSTIDKTFLATPQNRLKWLPVKVTASGGFALYQIYLTGKIIGDPVWQETGAFYEIGFILKDHGFYGVDEVADEDPPAVSAWTLRPVSSQVPPRSEGIFAMMDINPIVNATHGLRSPGSTDPVTAKAGTGNYVRGCGRAELDALNQYEYWLRGNPQLWIYGYTNLVQLGLLDGIVDLSTPVAGIPLLASTVIDGDAVMLTAVEGVISLSETVADDLSIGPPLLQGTVSLNQDAAESGSLAAVLQVHDVVSGMVGIGPAVESAIEDDVLSIGPAVMGDVVVSPRVVEEAVIGDPSIEGTVQLNLVEV